MFNTLSPEPPRLSPETLRQKGNPAHDVMLHFLYAFATDAKPLPFFPHRIFEICSYDFRQSDKCVMYKQTRFFGFI